MASEAKWPIRVGGVYPMVDRGTLHLRVREIVGDTIFYIHFDPNNTYVKEFGPSEMDASIFRLLCMPEDASPIPNLTKRVAELEAEIAKYMHCNCTADDCVTSGRDCTGGRNGD